MNLISDLEFDRDVEFLKLVRRESNVDLTLLALEIARDADPDLDFSLTLKWIDERIRELRCSIIQSSDSFEMLSRLSQCLGDEHGITGSAASYNDESGSFLNRVIETRTGIPIALSLLYMSVAHPLGIDLQGVAAPMHFLLRHESLEGPIFLDPFSGGRLMNLQECEDWINAVTGIPYDVVSTSLFPADNRTIVLRQLNNLKNLYLKQDRWGNVWPVQRRLLRLEPSSYEQRRDLGLIAMKIDRPGLAIDALSSCLTACPSEDKEMLERTLNLAHNQIASWN